MQWFHLEYIQMRKTKGEVCQSYEWRGDLTAGPQKTVQSYGSVLYLDWGSMQMIKLTEMYTKTFFSAYTF